MPSVKEKTAIVITTGVLATGLFAAADLLGIASFLLSDPAHALHRPCAPRRMRAQNAILKPGEF
jgi:hypothetical protein